MKRCVVWERAAAPGARPAPFTRATKQVGGQRAEAHGAKVRSSQSTQSRTRICFAAAVMRQPVQSMKKTEPAHGPTITRQFLQSEICTCSHTSRTYMSQPSQLKTSTERETPCQRLWHEPGGFR